MLLETEVVVALVVLVQAVGVALINGMFARRERSNEAYRAERERKEAERERAERAREEQRNERDDLMVGLIFAAIEGDEVLLRIAQGEQADGNVDRAVGKIERARSQYNEFVNKLGVRI